MIWYLCGPSATDAMNTALTDAQKNSIWYPKFLVFSKDFAAQAAQQPAGRHAGQQLRHVPALHADLHHRHRGLPRAPHVQRLQALVVPVFGLLANLACMLFYLIGPFTVPA